MAKKYSVQMENDEVVSVEVDGVTYTNPDDIPDEGDRQKIQAMISRSTTPDPEKSGEDEFDREMAKDLREMRKQSASMPKLMVAIFLGVAAIVLIVAGISTYGAIRQISKEESVPGRVVDMVVNSSRDSQTGEVTQFAYPVVEFTPVDQRPQRVQMGEGSSPPEYAVGDAVVVLYDPQKPRDARIKSISSDVLLWLLPGITFVLGAAFVGAAIMVLKFFMPGPEEAAPDADLAPTRRKPGTAARRAARPVTRRKSTRR